MVWPYHDEYTRLIGYVCRYDTREGKQFLPFTLWRTERAPEGEWLCRTWPAPRPLYGADLLAAYLFAIVIICEGEKATNAAQRIFPLPYYVCITSPGGSNAAHKADWSAIYGREIWIWPDNDAAGQKYAGDIAAILHGHCNVKILPIPEEKPSGWDAADALAEGGFL